MTQLDQRRLDRLYKLLERLERGKDLETAAALRWAIFQLEHKETAPNGAVNHKSNVPVSSL